MWSLGNNVISGWTPGSAFDKMAMERNLFICMNEAND
jgi:hypothetical protein